MSIDPDSRPTVTLILPAYNEEALIASNVGELLSHTGRADYPYRVDLLVVDDGSGDSTGEIADDLARKHPARVRCVHHCVNQGLGAALTTGLGLVDSDYAVILDVDLSYAPYHVERMVDALRENQSQLALASPYMDGGTVSNVPALRLLLSRGANRFLTLFTPGGFSTLTCMVRGMTSDLARALCLRSTGMDIMPEMAQKAMILRARIVEVPADLDWAKQNAVTGRRKSSLRLARQIVGTILSGFILRPFAFLMLPGLAILLFALFSSYWMLVHFLEAYAELVRVHGDVDPTNALRLAYSQHQHTFVVALLSLLLAILLFGLGLLAYQAKRYYEDLFYLGSTLLARMKRLPQVAARDGQSPGSRW